MKSPKSPRLKSQAVRPGTMLYKGSQEIQQILSQTKDFKKQRAVPYQSTDYTLHYLSHDSTLCV